MERLGHAATAVLILIPVALLGLWAWAEWAKADERVYVSAYCLERDAIDALIVADRKGPDAIAAARRGVFASGACKNLPYLVDGRVVADHGIHRGRKCDWRIVEIQIKAEPLPVWSGAPRNCGQTS